MQYVKTATKQRRYIQIEIYILIIVIKYLKTLNVKKEINKMVQFKVEEIKDHARDYLVDALQYNPHYIDENDIYEIHHDIFNTDYYIIGRYEALQWCQNMQSLLIIVDSIRCYEEDNFGEVTTDLSEPEKIVNMYVYMIGEEIIEEVVNEVEELQVVKLNKQIKQNKNGDK